LQVRDLFYPGRGIRVPGWKNTVLRIRDVYPDPITATEKGEKKFAVIPFSPGVKNALDPGSGTATLENR